MVGRQDATKEAAYEEEGGADGTDHIAPDASAVHELHESRQLELEQRAHSCLEEDLEVALFKQAPGLSAFHILLTTCI